MMEEYRKDVMKALEAMLGEGYEITPQDRRDNNCPVLHGICIRKKGEALAPVIYLEELMLYCLLEKVPPEQLPKALLQIYRQEEISQDIADRLDDFRKLKDLVRIKLINYEANAEALEDRPHRRFLDLAVVYYLDLEKETGIKETTAEITDKVASAWGIMEEELHRLGMERLLHDDGCRIIEMSDMLRDVMKGEPEEKLREIERSLKRDADMCMADCREQRFGAACLFNASFLQETAEKKGCDLLIYPSSIYEIMILAYRNWDEDRISPQVVREMNERGLPREARLSNCIYRYDREKKEVSIFRKGDPL
ncbi:MAG: hypothetical protein K1W37_07125 [Lachnospiraceae bacterium]